MPPCGPARLAMPCDSRPSFPPKHGASHVSSDRCRKHCTGSPRCCSPFATRVCRWCGSCRMLCHACWVLRQASSCTYCVHCSQPCVRACEASGLLLAHCHDHLPHRPARTDTSKSQTTPHPQEACIVMQESKTCHYMTARDGRSTNMGQTPGRENSKRVLERITSVQNSQSCRLRLPLC